jgi:sulfonate transport system substrate-binding protein
MIPQSPARRRLTPLALSLVAAAALAAACSSSPASSAGTSNAPAATGSVSATSLKNVTLHVGDQAGSGSQALLTAAGLIGKLPFKVDWSDFTSGPPMLQAMGTGAVDVGAVGDAPPVFEAAGGGQIALVAATVSAPTAEALLLPKGSTVTSVAQLKGKAIAVTEGSAADYHLLIVLKQAGLTVHDVTIENLQPAQAQAAFASGHVAAWDIWSPFIEQAEVSHGARVLVNGTATGKTYGFEVASRSALSDPAKVAAIRDYLALVAQAHAWANTHPAAWAATWSAASGLPVPVMTQAAKDDTAVTVPVTAAVISSEQSVANAFSTAGLVPGHVNIASFAVATFNGTATNPAGGTS